MERVYIGGSISNNPNYLQEFEQAEVRLMKQGYMVVNPVRNKGPHYKDYIDQGLEQLKTCDRLYLLTGYERSEGAMLELFYAKTVGMPIQYEKIDHPQHYNVPGHKECIVEMMELYGVDKVITFCELNSYKYRYRHELKGGEEDLLKAAWYEKKKEELRHRTRYTY